jgi:hypothetical protein
MVKINTRRRKFNTIFRQSTILHPSVQAAKMDRDWQPSRQDYIDVPTIATRGSWPMVHMIGEDTFVQMAILAGHVKPKHQRRLAAIAVASK